MYGDDYEGQYYTDNKASQIYNPRLGFVKKVYGILCAQLAITVLFVYLACKPFYHLLMYGPQGQSCYYSQACQPTTGALVFLGICLVVTLVVSIMLTCYSSFARSVPTNYILLALFTVCEAYMVGFVATMYSFQTVILAAIMTLALTLSLTIYAMTTKTDFTLCAGIFVCLGWCLIAISIMVMWVTWGNLKAYTISTVVIASISVCIYGIYLVIDTQLIMGGKRYSFTLDDYIVAALVIYIDIIVLFLKLLQIFGARGN